GGWAARAARGRGDLAGHIAPPRRGGRGGGRRRAGGGPPPGGGGRGCLVGVVPPPLVTLGLVALRAELNLTSDVLIFLLAVIVVALVGGLVPALLAAVAGSLLLNYYFTPPIHKWTIAETNNVLALGVFVVVAVLVSWVVDNAPRGTPPAAPPRAASDPLATTAGSVLRGERPVTAVLDRVREAFGMESVTLLQRRGGPGGRPVQGPGGEWIVVAHSGEPALAAPDGA